MSSVLKSRRRSRVERRWMDPDEHNREHVLGLVRRALPARFWRGLQDRTRSLYPDMFNEVRNNPRLNDSQRLSVLWQDRHFAMEWLLKHEAEQNGVPASDNMIPRNRYHFTLAGDGPIRVVQNYVRKPGSMPRPARFRRELASINAFEREPMLDLIEEEKPLNAPSEVTGVILSSPVGSTFSEEHQTLGTLGFHVPYKDFSGWAVSLTFAEILASYEEPLTQVDNVVPTIRRIRKTGDEE